MVVVTTIIIKIVSNYFVSWSVLGKIINFTAYIINLSESWTYTIIFWIYRKRFNDFPATQG